MKILSIRLKNLASLAGEHFIDFESDPLASAGLIAIVGKTGAGKSTILDAMCLSLFNKVPRLKESDGKLQDVDGSELAVNSPMTVLRRGCGHAFAELCFVAPDQKRYLARWEIKRARENPTGKLQNVQRSLKCLNDNMVLADKLKAVDEQVKLITQLSFDQFTRAVLLAQSEVTAFLKARDNERGELLEYLTNSVIFGKIGELAYRKTADIAKQRKQLEDVLGHIEILDADQLQQLQHTLAVSNQAVQDLSLEQKQLEQQQQWFQRQDKLQLELNNKQQALAQQQQLDQQLAADKLQRSKLDLCASIRPVLLQKQQQFQQQQQLAPQLHQAQQSFAQLTQQFELEQKNFLQDEQQLTQSQDFEQQYQPQLKQLRHCIDKRELIIEQLLGAKRQQTELQQQQQPLVAQQQQIHVEQQQLESALNTLSQQLQFSQAFQALDTGLDAHIQQLQQFIPAYTPIEQTLGHLKHAEQQLEQQQQALAQLEQQHGKLEQLESQLEQQRQQREVQLQLCSQLERIQQQCQQLQARDTELKNLQQQAAQHQVQQQTLSTQISAADNSYQQAKQQRMQLFDILQQQRLLHAENIEHLRADLKAGQPCVVCGSLDHPYRDNSQAISKALFELQQQQLKHAEADEQLALQHWQTQQQDASTCNASLAHIQKQIQSLSAELHQLQQQIKQHLDLPALAQRLPVQQPDDQQLIQLSSDAQRSCQQHVQQLEQQIKHATQGVKDLQSAAQQMQQQHYTLLQAKQLCAQIQHILPAEQTLASQPLTIQVQIILETLLQRAQQLKQQQQMQQRQQQLLQDLSRCHISLDSLVLQITALEQRLAEIEQQGLENTEIAIQQIQAMTGLSEQKPKEWLQNYDATLLQQQQRYRQSKLSFDQLRQQYEQQKQALQQLSSQSQHHAQNVEHATAEIERWLKQHPQLELAELEALLLLSSADEQRMRQALKQAEQALTQADAALKATQQQLDEHRQQQPAIDLDTLNSSLISQEQRLALQIEQRDQLKLKFELHQQSLSKQQQFMDQILEIQQQEHRWSKISDLMGSSTGKVFRDIAQQYHLDILIEYANQQLSLLSQRYTLKRLENSLSLAIIDHDMDGEMRSVSSLSGGESFLTALALSLAIANMASGSMKIESLFIDEGFGTLDAASLHMVMNALDQLQSQGRKVVLISHIQDMHERIPVQIQVNPRGAGASSIEIVG